MELIAQREALAGYCQWDLCLITEPWNDLNLLNEAWLIMCKDDSLAGESARVAYADILFEMANETVVQQGGSIYYTVINTPADKRLVAMVKALGLWTTPSLPGQTY